MLKFAKVAANTALVAEIRELLTGSAQSATRAGKKNYLFLYQIQANLDLRNPIFSFLIRELSDLEMNLKTNQTEKKILCRRIWKFLKIIETFQSNMSLFKVSK